MEQTLPAEITSDKKRYSAKQQRQKRKLIRWTILFCILLIPIFIWIQKLLLKEELALPFDNNILIFALININVLLVLFVLFLVLRYLAELLFERKINRPGSKLKTKLIASFLSLTLVPTILLFFVSLQFVSTSMDYWFNASIEDSLTESLKLAQSLLKEKEEQVTQMSKGIAERLKQLEISSYTSETISQTLENILSFNTINGPDSITLITHDKNLEITVLGPGLRSMVLPKIPLNLIQRVREQQIRETVIQEISKGDLVRCIAEIQIGNKHLGGAILSTSLLVKKDQLVRMRTISQGIEGYRQLKHFKEPFKFWLLIILLIVTLLVVFAAIWFGLYISRGITNPLEKLVLATQRVAEGDLEFEMERDSNDEMGLLVDSFNKMTINLNSSNKSLGEAHTALQLSSQESEQRRRYTEIILHNVSAGVISMDETGQITTINRFAETLLNIDKTLFIGLNFNDVLPPYQAAIVQNFIDELLNTGKITVEQHIKLNVLGKSYSLLINFTRLEDELENPLGFVLVFDNLTKLEKMQRMAAWREVARRIAHEIKNPLTPIQLSAQRLRRRYPDILTERNSVFDQCTSTIITQVDELKRLVSEFSQFARMPKVQKSQNNLTQLAENTLILYREAHKHINFRCTETEPIPVFSFDGEQIKRCLINLIDNGVAVLPDGGTIHIELSPDAEMENVFIKVYDDGPGISKENKLKLFEPYFSTKKTGTGLGLAIISTIISDHNGYIRVQDNEPKGSVFIIELPLLNKEE
ncbi:MAG: PAS domain-containing sensor histidine kinase [Desulfobulbaceae bacterium S3730MH12]|nr:MAG: PAS domain-containing sensor histidine kinase [Desulfobulbaceae bacterium S5133MH15]OEU55561.1 MAG: PAS domain-containing sensor histidine kinase [Desulfobulbaceae bacterium S3730MH12]OEU81229.1 MAG: PAS domain-containing sensor histidine kinase [Desulfobulbaceae bacterium C00003063]